MNGHYFFFGLLIIFLISMPVFLLWDWNRHRETSIKALLIRFWHKRKVYIGIFIGIVISEFFIPLNRNHGFEFNPEREVLGIPELKSDWEKDKSQSGKYKTYWWKPEPLNGHFKKVIEYGIFNAKTETDYYHNEKREGTFAWSTYDFGDETFQYFIQKPNDKTVSVTETGKLKIEKPTVTERVEKSEFEAYISE